MRHEEIEALMRFLDGEASESERRWIRWRLASSREFREEFVRLRRVSLDLRRLAAVPWWREDRVGPER